MKNQYGGTFLIANIFLDSMVIALLSLALILGALAIQTEEVKNDSIQEEMRELRKHLTERAELVDWQISELSMLAGDAIAIAGAAYETAEPNGSEIVVEGLTTEQADSVLLEARDKTYGLMWTEIKGIARIE